MMIGSSSKKSRSVVSALPPHVGQRFGLWTVLSAELERRDSEKYVRCACECGTVLLVGLQNLRMGKSTACRSCAARRRHAEAGHHVNVTPVDRTLQLRVSNWFSRCGNSGDGSYRNYGARGIECRFASVKEGVEYVKKTLPHPTYAGLDIDRKDNEGHYEPGNLRLVTRKVNLLNKRGGSTVSWRGASIPTSTWVESPYSLTCTMRYAARGLSGEDILRRAWLAVQEKRKGWRTIQLKLLATTS